MAPVMNHKMSSQSFILRIEEIVRIYLIYGQKTPNYNWSSSAFQSRVLIQTCYVFPAPEVLNDLSKKN